MNPGPPGTEFKWLSDGAQAEFKGKNYIKKALEGKSRDINIFTIAHHMSILDGLCDGYHWIYRTVVLNSFNQLNPPEIKTNRDLYNYSKTLDPTHGKVTFYFNYHQEENMDYITRKMKLLCQNSDLPMVTSAENLSDTFYGLEAIVKLDFFSDGTVKAFSKYDDIIGDLWTLNG